MVPPVSMETEVLVMEEVVVMVPVAAVEKGAATWRG